MFPNAGSAQETSQGMLLDEQTELELALFMSLQDQEHVQAQAPAAAESQSESESAESVPELLSESEAESSDTESESIEATSGAESVAMAAAAQARSAAAAAAFQAESAASAATAHAESAANAAAAHAESAANAAVAQAESAATTAAAHAAAAANTVAAHVEAAAKSVDAALNHQAASVRGTVLSFADHLDGWWPRRPRQRGPQRRGPQLAGGQQRGPQETGQQQEGPEHSGPQQAGVQQRGPQQADVQQRGPQVGVQASHSTASATIEQASAEGNGPAALSMPASDSAHQEEEASLAEAAEQMQSPAQETDLRASRVHSVSSDDSSFDLTEVPAAAPALPIDQFAALSLLDFDSVVPSFEDLDGSQDPDADDSPFDVHSEDHEGTASSHISIDHADVAMTDAGQAVPVIPWDATNTNQDLRHHFPQVQGSDLPDLAGFQASLEQPGSANANTAFSCTSLSGSNEQSGLRVADSDSDAPVSYPQIDASPFSASMRSESPVRYPQLHKPTYHPNAGSSHQVQQPASPGIEHVEPSSPRTQMHLTALGSGAFGCQSSGDEAQHDGEHEAGDMTSTGGSAVWPLEAEEVEEPAEAAASIHVHQGLHLTAVHNVARPCSNFNTVPSARCSLLHPCVLLVCAVWMSCLDPVEVSRLLTACVYSLDVMS